MLECALFHHQTPCSEIALHSEEKTWSGALIFLKNQFAFCYPKAAWDLVVCAHNFHELNIQVSDMLLLGKVGVYAGTEHREHVVILSGGFLQSLSVS